MKQDKTLLSQKLDHTTHHTFNIYTKKCRHAFLETTWPVYIDKYLTKYEFLATSATNDYEHVIRWLNSFSPSNMNLPENLVPANNFGSQIGSSCHILS